MRQGLLRSPSCADHSRKPGSYDKPRCKGSKERPCIPNAANPKQTPTGGSTSLDGATFLSMAWKAFLPCCTKNAGMHVLLDAGICCCHSPCRCGGRKWRLLAQLSARERRRCFLQIELPIAHAALVTGIPGLSPESQVREHEALVRTSSCHTATAVDLDQATGF